MYRIGGGLRRRGSAVGAPSGRLWLSCAALARVSVSSAGHGSRACWAPAGASGWGRRGPVGCQMDAHPSTPKTRPPRRTGRERDFWGAELCDGADLPSPARIQTDPFVTGEWPAFADSDPWESVPRPLWTRHLRPSRRPQEGQCVTAGTHCGTWSSSVRRPARLRVRQLHRLPRAKYRAVRRAARRLSGHRRIDRLIAPHECCRREVGGGSPLAVKRPLRRTVSTATGASGGFQSIRPSPGAGVRSRGNASGAPR